MDATKVAIVDSGLRWIDDKYKDNFIDGIAIDPFSKKINRDFADNNGHGTYCANMILKENPGVKLFIIKILNNNVKSDYKSLIKALEYLLDVDVKIINLSLSVQNWECEKQIYELCDRLIDQGKIIVSALANGSEYSIPAVLDNVIGVSGDYQNVDRLYSFNKEKKIQCMCNAEPVIFAGLNQKYEIFMGNSKATAAFSGYLSRFIRDENYYLLEEKLHGLEKKGDKQVEIYRSAPVDFIEECGKLLRDITKKDIIGIPITNPNYLFLSGLNTHNFSEFLIKCEKNWGITIKVPVPYRKIFSLDYLYNIFGRNNNE